MSKATKTSLSPLQLTRQTISDWRQKPGRILLITAIVAIPGSILRIVQLDSTTNMGIITSIAGLYLTLTLTWAFLNQKELLKFRFTQLYVKASGRFLPFLLASILFSLVALPIILGGLILTLAAAAQIPVWLGLVGVAVIIASLYFLIRISLMAILVVQNEISAIGALRLSWQLTKKRVFKLVFAWGLLLLGIVIISGLIISALDLITFVRENDYAQAILSGLLLTFLLPLFVGYGVTILNHIEQANE